jgi:hypothetical protein
MNMANEYEPDFQALEINIIDVIKEEQIKLGYQSETIRLYYPIESLNSLLGTTISINELQKVLDEFSLFVETRLGKVQYSNKDTRFCIVIPPNGVAYVNEEVEDKHFLREFIDKIREHPCSFEDILNVFHKYSDKVKYERMENGEFDYLIYFDDGQPDEYKYCIKFEDSHAIYHRYSKIDYENLAF